MSLSRFGIVLLGSSWLYTTPAWADVLPEEEEEEEEEQDDEGGSDTADGSDDGGCATAQASGSLGALLLSMGLVIGLRRREH